MDFTAILGTSDSFTNCPNRSIQNDSPLSANASDKAGSITFPSDTDGETYTFFLRPSAHFNTELANNLVSKSLNSDGDLVERDYNKYLYTTVIQQKANVTVTVRLKS